MFCTQQSNRNNPATEQGSLITESLYPPEYFVIASVIRDVMKGTKFINKYQDLDL
jgi:hypothetical protein